MPVPPRFVGMDVTVPVFTDQVPSDEQFTTMVASGVETIRIAFNWAGAQPYKNWLSVPVDQLGSFQSGVRGVPDELLANRSNRRDRGAPRRNRAADGPLCAPVGCRAED